MKCKHENKLSLYARKKNNWISTEKLAGDMIYCCTDCGAIFVIEFKFNKVNVVKKEVQK